MLFCSSRCHTGRLFGRLYRVRIWAVRSVGIVFLHVFGLFLVLVFNPVYDIVPPPEDGHDVSHPGRLSSLGSSVVVVFVLRTSLEKGTEPRQETRLRWTVPFPLGHG